MALGEKKITRTGVATIRVEGIEKTLKALKKFDKELFNASIDAIRSPLEAAEMVARSKYPPDKFMYGWRNKPAKKPIPPNAFPPYSQRRAMDGVKSVVNKRTGKRARTYKIAALVQTNPGGMIFDMARNSPNNFSSNLMRMGTPSRIMWPSMKAMRASIVAAIMTASKRATTAVQLAMPERKVTE